MSGKKRDTQYIVIPSELLADSPVPRVFVCSGGTITEYVLDGEQTIGRPDVGNDPDIPIADSYVSRQHGRFRTTGEEVEYEADKTKNGVYLNRVRINPGQRVSLRDGDELSIPSISGENRVDITLQLAFSEAKIDFWRELRDSSKDRLTGLGDRRHFENWWANSLSHSDYWQACLFILDVDNFKQINDGLGHAMGDKVLAFLAEKLRGCVRSEEQLCRWGGDEFTGIIPGNAQSVRTRLRKMADEIAAESFDGVRITLSIGLLEIDERAKRVDLEQLVKLADQAMYEAKNKGKDGICVFEKTC